MQLTKRRTSVSFKCAVHVWRAIYELHLSGQTRFQVRITLDHVKMIPSRIEYSYLHLPVMIYDVGYLMTWLANHTLVGPNHIWNDWLLWLKRTIPINVDYWTLKHKQLYYMMTSSNGIIFRVTDALYGEFTCHQWIPLTKASGVELWCFFFISAWTNKVLSKQPRRRWFETSSGPLWRHGNEHHADKHA